MRNESMRWTPKPRARRPLSCLLWATLLGSGTWLSALPGAVSAQVKAPVETPLDDPAPLRLESRAGIRAVAHGNDGLLVLGGQEQERFGGCGPQSRAFLAAKDAGGETLWHSGSELLTEITSLDSRHILASTVHDVTVDDATGEIFAAVEALVGWRGESCPGVDAARGTVVLRLAPGGALLHDTYLGTRPEGAPTRTLGCSELCAPERYDQVIGTEIETTGDGGVVVTGQRLTASTEPIRNFRDEARFETLLRSDLSSEVDLAFAKSQAAGPPPGVQCSLGETNVMEVRAVHADLTDDSNPRLLGASDGCIIKLHPDGSDIKYGIEIEISVPNPLPDPLKIDLKLQFMGGFATRKHLSLKRSGPVASDFDEIKSWLTDSNGRLEKTANLTNLTTNFGTNILDYILPGDRLIFRLEGYSVHIFTGNCDESYEYDRGG